MNNIINYKEFQIRQHVKNTNYQLAKCDDCGDIIRLEKAESNFIGTCTKCHKQVAIGIDELVRYYMKLEDNK